MSFGQRVKLPRDRKETKSGKPRHRACVVIAGGREPPHWEAYPHHQFISTNGALPCCSEGGCWKSRCQLVGDGDSKDRSNLCDQPVQITPELRIPKCLDMITPQDVIRRIELYYQGGALSYLGNGTKPPAPQVAAAPATSPPRNAHDGNGAASQPKKSRVLIRFRHGLGDAVQLGIVLKHLSAKRPEWDIDVTAMRGKHSALHGLCRQVFHDQEAAPDPQDYAQRFDLDWHEQNRPAGEHSSTKVARCLQEVFGIEPDPKLFTYDIRISTEARQRAAQYLQSICGDGQPQDGRWPVLLLHYEGNTSADQKNLSHETAKAVCETAIQVGLTPVILDWDRRSPLPDQRRIFCPPTGQGDMWGEFGSGDAEVLAALIEQSALMIGVDSGPLHVAGATTTPTIAVWTQHFPAQYFDLAENVLHFVPENWETIGFGGHAQTAAYFREHYRFRTYRHIDSDLTAEIIARRTQESESALVQYGKFFVRRDNIAQDMVIVRDIYEQDAYRTCLLSSNAGPQIVLDIGAHIGCFAMLWHEKNPEARIICVEACPENLEALRANVGAFAEVVHAACTYETQPVALLNAVRPDCESTGGSVVVPRSELETSDLRQEGYSYWHDLRELPKVTLEDLMQRFGFDRIDVLKLDCEGSEYSILGHTPSRSRIRMMVGEYHGRRRWDEFRSQQFADWDYGHMLDGGENGGLFHLANPVWPPPSQHAGFDFFEELRQAFMPSDRQHLTLWEPYYRTLYGQVRELQPRRIVEIGVRAGYSGLVFLLACPDAEVWGFDAATEPDSEEHQQHARRILEGRNYHLHQVDSHTLSRLPQADLIYIDGDHSYAGCAADLRLAADAAGCILVDDYGTVADVSRAVDEFVTEHPGEFRFRRLDFQFGDGRSGAIGLLERLTDRRMKLPALINPPLLRIAVPAGIGDSVWALMKVPDILSAYGAKQAHIALCGPPPFRAKSFVERFDFVASVEYSQWLCVEQPPYTAEGVYNWAPSGIGWHYEFDWMLQANRHLETGLRLETWLPEFATDWRIADRFHFTGKEVRLARELKEELGPYCVFYLGPEAGNTTAGHNRGPLWTPEDWGRLAGHCRALGLAIVVVGADYDRSYFEKYVAPHLGDCYDAIGQWPVGQTFAVVQRCRFIVSYQSGIGIFAVYMGIPAAVFWRPHGDSIEAGSYVSFQETMASAWAPQEALDSGRYLPSIYTRCSPDSLIEHARTHHWHQGE